MSAETRPSPAVRAPGAVRALGVVRLAALAAALATALTTAACAAVPGTTSSPPRFPDAEAAGPAGESDIVAATPQRPGLSFDSNTTAEGTFELEAGGIVDVSESRELPLTLKYGAGPATEVFVGWSPYVHLERSGTDDRGAGDTVLGARHRFHEADGWAAAAQLAVKLHTGSESKGISSGENDVFVALTANGGDGPWFWTTYYQLGLLGETDGSGRDGQHGVALVGGRSLGDGVAGLVELAGLFSPELEDPVFGTAAVTWSARPDLVWDAGVEVGLNEAATDARLFLGATYNFGRRRATRR